MPCCELGGGMNRRELFTVVSGATGALIACLRDVHAQNRIARVGALVGFTENDAEGELRIAAFRGQLQELGWSEDHNLQIDFRYVPGDAERMRPAAAELVALTPDVIFV